MYINGMYPSIEFSTAGFSTPLPTTMEKLHTYKDLQRKEEFNINLRNKETQQSLQFIVNLKCNASDVI